MKTNYPFTLRRDNHGITYFRCSDELRDALKQEFAYFGYIVADENSRIAKLSSDFSRLVGSTGVEYLSMLAAGSNNNGVIIFENLPHDKVDWSPFPGMQAHSAKQSSLSEHLILAISSFFGQAYGVANEGIRLVNDLIPSKEQLHRHTGNGSRMELGLHYENAALRFISVGQDFSPKGLLLTGVCEQTNGPVTPVAIASQAVALLPEWAHGVLRKPCTRIALPERQRITGKTSEIEPVPVIFGPYGGEEIVAAFYGDMMRPISKQTEEALALLNDNLLQVAINLSITPGMLVYLSNGKVLHGRSSFHAQFDEYGRAKRWVQRVFVTGRLDHFFEGKAMSDRVFDLSRIVEGYSNMSA